MVPTGKKDNILIVSGDGGICDEICKALNHDFSCQLASTIPTAMNAMAFKVPDLIIADSDVSGGGGIELLKLMRKSIKTKLLPFIIVIRSDNSSQRIQALEAGADGSITHPFNSEELKALVKSSLNKFREFYLLSITDELTRLFNRREFIKKFNDETAASPERTISLAILDLDFFKQVNDLYGHQTGDTVLMKLAELLQDRACATFFPARFGGEEFVILFTDTGVDDARNTMEELLGKFSRIEFNKSRKYFRVTFSAGLAEYPAMAKNVSELLSRADQALYAAKKEGRNRVYAFSPFMGHNDQFWEYMRSKQGHFTDIYSNDAITGLPFLPQLLETVSDLDFEIRSIGVLVLSLKAVYDMEEYSGLKNINYDLENIKLLILNTCELIFPSDTYLGLSDIYTHEFIVLFPSAIDFSFNQDKFRKICGEISSAINRDLRRYNFRLAWSCGVLTIDPSNTREIIKGIASIRKKTEPINAIPKEAVPPREFTKSDILLKKLKIRTMFQTVSGEKAFQYFSLQEPHDHDSILESIITKRINTASKLERLLCGMAEKFHDDVSLPVLLPCTHEIRLRDCLEIMTKTIPGKEIIMMINECHIRKFSLDEFDSFFKELPVNITIGIDNCYIGTEILNLLSSFNFSFLVFSENIIRNIFMFKDRIKIISGLKLFLDQIGVKTGAKDIFREEEYQIIRDLGIGYATGRYFESRAFRVTSHQ